MTRTIKFTAQRGDLKTQIVIKHEEKSAYTPDTKKEVEKIKNEIYDFLRNRGYNFSDIKLTP